MRTTVIALLPNTWRILRTWFGVTSEPLGSIAAALDMTLSKSGLNPSALVSPASAISSRTFCQTVLKLSVASQFIRNASSLLSRKNSVATVIKEVLPTPLSP